MLSDGQYPSIDKAEIVRPRARGEVMPYVEAFPGLDPGPMPGEFLDAIKKRDTPPTIDQDSDLITGRIEIAAALGITHVTLTALMQAGKIPFPIWRGKQHKMFARRADVLKAGADRSWRPRRGRGPTKAGPELIRDPGCAHYEQCLDKYARQDRKGRPMGTGGEHPGWSCDGCPRYGPAGPRDPADIKLLCFVAYLACGLDPSEAFGDVRRHDARVQALPCAE